MRKPIAYIPDNAEINLKTKQMSPPKVKYEKSKQNIDIETVKKITKGKYGKD